MRRTLCVRLINLYLRQAPCVLIVTLSVVETTGLEPVSKESTLNGIYKLSPVYAGYELKPEKIRIPCLSFASDFCPKAGG